MAHHVTGSVKHGAAKNGRLREISIHRAGNGFHIRKHHDPMPSNGPMMMPPDEDGQVFTKHAPARKHIAALMAEMHPPEPTSGEMTGEEPENQQS